LAIAGPFGGMSPGRGAWRGLRAERLFELPYLRGPELLRIAFGRERMPWRSGTVVLGAWANEEKLRLDFLGKAGANPGPVGRKSAVDSQ
jgi:hypothetical protein